MNNSTEPKTSINPFKRTDHTKSIFQNATDTIAEVIVLFILATLIAGIAFAAFEGKTVFDGIWWAIVTGFTVGYGDIAPITLGGRTIGALLMTFSNWIMLPLIIVLFIRRHLPDRNAFTHEEQEENARIARENNEMLKQLTAKKSSPFLKNMRVKTTNDV